MGLPSNLTNLTWHTEICGAFKKQLLLILLTIHHLAKT